MTPGEAFIGLAKRCRWRTAELGNGRCRFDPDEPRMACSLTDCPAMALGITAACVIPELPRHREVTVTTPQKGKRGKKGPQGPQDPLKAAIEFVAGLTGFIPEEEEPDNER